MAYPQVPDFLLSFLFFHMKNMNILIKTLLANLDSKER